jgi:hypothetical protein
MLKNRTHPEQSIRLLWAAKFRLPPNDPRLLQVTIREALEQVHGVAAVEQLTTERATEQRAVVQQAQKVPRFLGGDSAAMLEASHDAPVQATTRTDSEARSVADTPHLTGDPEWDALELAETDPSKPPLKIQW